MSQRVTSTDRADGTSNPQKQSRMRTASHSPRGKAHRDPLSSRDAGRGRRNSGDATHSSRRGSTTAGVSCASGRLNSGAVSERNTRTSHAAITGGSVLLPGRRDSGGGGGGGQTAGSGVVFVNDSNTGQVFTEDLSGGVGDAAAAADGAPTITAASEKVRFVVEEVSDTYCDNAAAATAVLRRSYSGSSGSSPTQGIRRNSSSTSISKSNPPSSFLHPSSRGYRRGSSVTFNLPAHVSTSEDSSTSSNSRRQSLDYDTEDPASLAARFYSLYSRRMSAPELPPIADRERPRPPSRSTSRSSLNQLTAAVNSKNFYTRLTNGAKLPRNHSDSSLKGLLAGSASHHRSSGSVSSYLSGGGGVGGTPGAGGEQLLPPAQPLRSASRALSWCATDNSTGSIPKLETLFEKKNALNDNHDLLGTTTSVTNTPPLATKNNNINNNNNNSTNNKNLTTNNMIPPRSVSVNGMRGPDLQELTKVPKGRRKRLQSECDAGDEVVGTIEQFGRLKVNGMRRSSSENKLTDKKNVRNARLNSSRHLSVGRTDKLTQRRSKHGPPTSNASLTNKTGMRRVHSVSALNVTSNRTSRLGSVFQDGLDVEGGSGDSEEEEEKSFRIREWLDGLEFADVPPDPVIDYADDPPQTDTAVHIVYKDE